ncbi:hypothetical protein PHYSODRAFT_482860, partial [Phytophthora sojae]
MQPAVARSETWRRKESTTRRQLSKRGRGDGDTSAAAAAAGEFVRLAAVIDDCAAFNPKQWRHVLDKSATVLRQGGQASSNLSNERRMVERTEKKTSIKRPLSREEEEEYTLVDGLGVFPTLSVTQYLNQPDMVKDILREAEGAMTMGQQQSEEGVIVEEEEVVVVDPEIQ